MADRKLHIVCLQVPYPPAFGGVIDLFWKLKYLSACGVNIILHCFDNGGPEQTSLQEFCTQVYYYPRINGWRSFSLSEPYIVTSRRSSNLEERLLQDNYPILLEGIHCTDILNNARFKNRKIFLRLHNVEHDYYRQLLKHSSSPVKSLYYWLEARLLKSYEPLVLNRATVVLPVSAADAIALTAKGHRHILHVPVLLPWDRVEAKTGMGTYCLYHGNLSIAENEKVAIWLLENVFSQLPQNCVIAGRNPSRRLKKLVQRHFNCRLVINPGDAELMTLIQNAQINVLPAFTNTGIKLKLLHALYQGRFCITNARMLNGTGLEGKRDTAESAEEWIRLIHLTFQEIFSAEMIEERNRLLSGIYNNVRNAAILTNTIFAQH